MPTAKPEGRSQQQIRTRATKLRLYTYRPNRRCASLFQVEVSASPSAPALQAGRGLQATDQAIRDLHDKFGDDADSRPDYHARERERDDYVATLVTVPALGADGVRAKAAVLRLRTLIEDYDRHQEVAVSLADDIAERGSPALRPVAAR